MIEIPSTIMPAETALKKGFPGIKRAIGGVKIRLSSGRWIKVPKSALVWHRGRGFWSVFSGSKHDRYYAAKTKIKRTKRPKYSHIGDAYKWV